MAATIETLLSLAVKAPSGDNTQPWRFVVDDEAGTVALDLDPTRDPSPMNSGQRMARIAVGAALENLLRAAKVHGWHADLDRDAPPYLARVLLARGEGGQDADRAEDAVAARVTNRRLYDGRPVPAEVLDRLKPETPDLDGTRTSWIVERGRIEALAPLIGRGDAAMFGQFAMLRAFLGKVRFDEAPDAEVAEGLSLASLEATGFERLALRGMAQAPPWLLNLAGATKVFAAKARQLVLSASGLCLVSAPDDAAATDLAVGRAMQSAWLALTREGLAAQPMMSLPVLENVLAHGDAALKEGLERQGVPALRDEVCALIPELEGGRLAWLMRFGFAPPPKGRTGRLPVEAVTTHTGPIREGVV